MILCPLNRHDQKKRWRIGFFSPEISETCIPTFSSCRVCWSIRHTVVSPVTVQYCVGLFSDHAEPSPVHHRATGPRGEELRREKG